MGRALSSSGPWFHRTIEAMVGSYATGPSQASVMVRSDKAAGARSDGYVSKCQYNPPHEFLVFFYFWIHCNDRTD
jgi:hypothetical protein